ncbi:MAG: M48 family metalloprotease [Proteobacteria bacterium]|nr:M48 family metalloprotease [Pseudomonadota bacterium]MBU1710696.1 M48 family metalloprotease [Pseudomonadota bacterium]
MIYNNLIYLLVVILILTTNTVPDTPQTPLNIALFIFVLKGFLYHLAARRWFAGKSMASAAQYFSAEQKLAILAIASLAIDVYFLDFKYYIAKLPFTGQLPVLIDLGGIILFHCYLSLTWHASIKSYQRIFERSSGKSSIVISNLKTNLSIILPWLLISFFSDLLLLAPSPGLQKILASSWGESIIILGFFLVLATVFPAIVIRLWGCTPLPKSDLRDHLENFCKRQGLGYANIMLWPLFEGRIITAGIMGIVKKFRYLLVTPALLESMSIEETEAVLAHEIGHAKRYHLQLYIFLFLGFGLLAQISLYPILYLLLNSELFYKLLQLSGKEPATALSLWGSVPLFILMIVYFRYVFGFFMRNFERQADLHALAVMGGSAPLTRVLEKISVLSGNIRDVPSWHHFSIGQRVDFLEKCESNKIHIKRHHRKVYGALLIFLLTLTSGAFFMWKMPTTLMEGPTREKFAEAAIRQKIREEPQKSAWRHLLGDLQLERKHYGEAIAAYEKALELAPYNPEVLNNLAWLLITAEDESFLDPARALELAESASTIKSQGYILDSLAGAYWANGYTNLAVKTEEKAMARDPANREFYLRQIAKFQSGAWSPAALRKNDK